MQRLTIPLHDFVRALLQAIADKDNGYIDHLIHDFVFCGENACAKIDQLPVLVETFSSPYIGTSDAQPAFAHHTSPATYVPRHSSGSYVAEKRLVAERLGLV